MTIMKKELLTSNFNFLLTTNDTDLTVAEDRIFVKFNFHNIHT